MGVHVVKQGVRVAKEGVQLASQGVRLAITMLFYIIQISLAFALSPRANKILQPTPVFTSTFSPKFSTKTIAV